MKILVFLKDFYIGGIQKSCVNFCNYLCLHKQNVDLVTINKDGPLFKELNKKINVIETNQSLLPFAVSKKQSKKFGLVFFIKRNLIALLTKFLGNKKFLNSALKKQPVLQQKYDIAISFAPSTGLKTLSVGSTEFVLQKTTAKKKYVFMHSDFEKAGLNNEYVIEQFKQFDKIFCVSESCAEGMKKCVPTLSKKVGYLYNFCNDKEIKAKAKEDLKLKRDETRINIISASRLSEEKGYLRSLKVFKKLIAEGKTNFIWHILGDGNERMKIEKYIKDNNMQEYVLLYGNKINPYPYIKQADLFYLGSYHESFGIVLVESMILGIPVLTTETCSANEIVGENGFVCDNTEEGIYECFKKLLTKNDLITSKKKLLDLYSFDNSKIYDKLINESR